MWTIVFKLRHSNGSLIQLDFGQTTFDIIPAGVRPPLIRVPPNMYHVPFWGETSNGGQTYDLHGNTKVHQDVLTE
jgi:hypothetical protein